MTLLKALFNLLQKSTRKLAAKRSTNLLFMSPSGAKTAQNVRFDTTIF